MDKMRVDIDIKHDNTECEKLCATVRIILIVFFSIWLVTTVFSIAFLVSKFYF